MEYARELVKDGNILPRDSEMVFWGLDDPAKMPGDARVDFFYTPTYLAVSILAHIKMKYPLVAIQIQGYHEILRKGLYASTGRNFLGHGHDDLKGFIDCLNIFASAEVFSFVEKYPDFCPKFTNQIEEAKKYLEHYLATGRKKGDWGEDYSKEASALIYKIRNEGRIKIFVYGTLLKGNSNHQHYLSSSKYLGEAILKGYGLYNISTYPGIKKIDGHCVKGELYEIDGDTLDKINQLEGEGSLYYLTMESVESGGQIITGVGVYAYMHNVDERKYVRYEEQPWRGPGAPMQDLVWYVAYGSNILAERFMCYINGGQFRNNGRDHKKCPDTTPPRAKMLYELPFDMYYGNHSGSWDRLGVSFLDATKPGKAYGVAYLVTKEQFEHIYREENGGLLPKPNSTWYNRILELGSIDTIPVKTFTNEGIVEKVDAGERYQKVLIEGLKENYARLGNQKITEYVVSRNHHKM